MSVITFVSHTNKPGGGELALRRLLEASSLPAKLITFEPGGVWENTPLDVKHVTTLSEFHRELRRSNGLIVSNSMKAALLSAIFAPRKARLVYWVRDGLRNSAMSPLALGLTKAVTAKRTSAYLANSEWTANTIVEALRVTPDRIHICPSLSGVPSVPAPSLTPRLLREPLRLLYLGRLAPWKAPDVAIRALPYLRQGGIPSTLTLAGAPLFGEAAYARSLKDLSAKDPTVSLVGHIECVDSLFQSHDLLVHCSTKPEPFGQVIVQALSAGLPVAATAHGGPLEILQGAPTVLTYDPGSPEALAQCVQQIVQKYPELQQWAKDRALRFSDEVALRRTELILKRLSSDT